MVEVKANVVNGPRLPFELLCAIFTGAAEGDTDTSLSLCRVSTSVSELITPLLYRTVALNSPRHIHKFLVRSSDRSKRLVRYLAVRQKYDIPVVNKMVGNLVGGSAETDFRKCINVEHLALCTPYPDRDLKNLRPKYVHFGMKEDPSLYRPDFAFLSNVTHVRLWFVLYHTRQLLSFIERFINVTHIRVQLDFDSLFERFRDEFTKDIAHILRLPYTDGHLEEAPLYAVFDPDRVRTQPVYLTLGICPSRTHRKKDVVAEFINTVESEPICKAAMMPRSGSVSSGFESNASEGDTGSTNDPRLVVIQSYSVDKIRLKPKSWKAEMDSMGEVF